MGKTYYDSTLTDAQIQQVLNAINNILSPSNNGKVLAISGGTLEARSVQWGGGYPEPTGTITLTENGPHDVKDYATANVQVQGGAVIQPLSVTQNSTYSPPSGVDGYAPVTVNVSGGDPDPFVGLSDYIEATGTQWINTGFAPNSNTRVECIVNPVKRAYTNEYMVLFGAERGTTAYFDLFTENAGIPCIGGCAYYDTQLYTEVYAPNQNRNIRPLVDNNILMEQKIYISMSPYEIIVKNTTNQKLVVSMIPTQNLSEPVNYPLWIFDSDSNGSHVSVIAYCRAKLYNFKIWDGNTLAMNLLPAKDQNNVVCLQDTISGNYFYNQGTGDFVYGTDA